MPVDTDGDGLTDIDELAGPGGWLPTNPALPDTDADGLWDGFELAILPVGTNPNASDTDIDGIDDGDAVNRIYGYATSPNDADTDDDTISDADEIFGATGYWLDPTDADTDADGLGDYTEWSLRLRPDLPDMDFDGLLDGDEVNRYGTQPILRDSDGDTVDDGVEVATGTDPNDPASHP